MVEKPIEPRYGDILEWPHAPMTGKRKRSMFICRDFKYKDKSALEDTMTAMTIVAGDYGIAVGEIRSGLGPVNLYIPIEQVRDE